MTSVPAGEYVRVFVLFDSAITRKWVIHQLRCSSRVQIAGEGSNPLAALDEIRSLKPDAVIMHSHDRRKFGIDLTDCIRNITPESKIIMLTSGLNENSSRENGRHGTGLAVFRFAEWEKVSQLLHSLCLFRQEPSSLRHYSPAG